MLILGRKAGQAVVIDNQIVVEVIDIGYTSVKLEVDYGFGDIVEHQLYKGKSFEVIEGITITISKIKPKMYFRNIMLAFFAEQGVTIMREELLRED